MLNPDHVTDLLRRSTVGDREALRRRAETPRPVVDEVLRTVRWHRQGELIAPEADADHPQRPGGGRLGR